MWDNLNAQQVERTMDLPDDRRYQALSGDLENAITRGDTAWLIEALSDASFNVRLAAVEGLADLGGEQARIALTRVARDRWGERPEFRVAALRSLARLVEPERYGSLLDEFVSGDNRKVVSAARSMLKSLDPGGFAARLVSRECVDHGAIREYGASVEASAVPLISRYFEERIERGDVASARHWGKVYAAVRALGNIGTEEAYLVLEELRARLGESPWAEAGGLAGWRLEKISRQAERELDASPGAGR